MSQLDGIVAMMQRPESYREPARAIRHVETHISHIFFTDQHVYKVKKPVDMGFLDFTTLRKRHRACRNELLLNRRLSPDVYLDIVPITKVRGHYELGGEGRAVEYAVKMRRLPEDRALSTLLRQRTASVDDVRRIAGRIAAFHSEAATNASITRAGGMAAARRNIEENFAQTAPFIGSAVSQESYDDIVAYGRAFLVAKREVFRRREREGRVRECHGDLHTAHVFMEDGISFIDCIEFNRRFRCCDVAKDIAFMAMDLDRFGRHDLSEAFVQAYTEASGDPHVRDLLPIFASYLAMVRAKVSCIRASQEGVSSDERAQDIETAREYFDLSRSYTAGMRPRLIMVVGLSGTGKTTVATELARRWDMAHVSSDIVRKRLAGVGAAERGNHGYDEGLYAPEMTRRTYDVMLGEAERVLRGGGGVVLDATYRHSDDRRRVSGMGRGYDAEPVVVQCVLPRAETLKRLRHRTRAGEGVSDATAQVYLQQTAEWEPVRETPAHRLIRLDTSDAPDTVMSRLLYGVFLAALR
ncbi:MAG: kinase [SAR202 cluster bacterium]|nr:kinase [SAR202 cluster bacterium]